MKGESIKELWDIAHGEGIKKAESSNSAFLVMY
jgi:hypothetical protein